MTGVELATHGGAPREPVSITTTAVRPVVVGPSARRYGIPLVPALVILLAVTSGLGAWARLSIDELDAGLSTTRAELDLTSNRLGTTAASLLTATNDLSDARAALEREKTARAAAERSVEQLQQRVLVQSSCIGALNDRVAELDEIRQLVINNYNRFAIGSVWANANQARWQAVSKAIDDYYNAFDAAYYGLRSTANSWIALGNAQLSIASDQVATMNGQVAAGNAAADAISGRLVAFRSNLDKTIADCGLK